jgi:hypothetical protein
MNTTRRTRAGIGSAAILAIVFAAVGGCASSSPAPGAAPTSLPPASTAPAPGSPTPSPSGVPTPRSSSPTPVPSEQVVLSRVAYAWRWPNADGEAQVKHTYSVPPVPELVQIGVGDHPRDPGERPFNRISFTFTTAFPSYRFEFTDRLTADASGRNIPLAGSGVLRIVFTQAQAHTADGAHSSIVSEPARHLGLSRMVDYAQAGDFEGVLSYGVGIAQPVPQSNPQFSVRVYEVEKINASGQHLYTVAFDVDAS